MRRVLNLVLWGMVMMKLAARQVQSIVYVCNVRGNIKFFIDLQQLAHSLRH